MRYIRTSTAFICVCLLAIGCSKDDRAQEKLQASLDTAEVRLAEGAAEARKALAAAMKRWDELRPQAERAIASLEERAEKLVDDSEALKRLPPDALERMRKHLDAMRARLAEAKAAHERGDTDLAVEKAGAVEKERAAAEEWLVERPDPR